MSTTLLARVLTPLALLGAASALLAAGADAPPWIVRLGELVRFTDAASVRFAAGLLASLALAALLVGRGARWLALVGAGSLAFAGIATLSAPSGLSTVALVVAATAALVGAALFFTVGTSPLPEVRPTGPSASWRILAVMGIACASLALAAAAPMRTKPQTRRDSPVSSTGERYVDLLLDTWEGSRLADTPLIEHLPGILDLIGDGPAWLVFYSPRCGHCHELFREHFATVSGIPIIAIEVPPPPDSEILESDQPEDIDCPSCQRVRLSPTRGWFITPPTVVRIERGIVRCVSEPNQGKSCFDKAG